MIDPIYTKPKGLLTLEDITPAFEAFYEPAILFNSEPVPAVRFARQSVEACNELAKFRRKNYSSSSPYHLQSEQSGIYGEGAIQKVLNVPCKDAAASFLAGLKGDSGSDFIWNGKKVDQKATMGQACRFRFSKTNKNRHVAEIFSFAWAEPVGQEYWVHLLGWAWRHEIKPWIRDEGRCLTVRFETLKREGVIKSVHMFNEKETTKNA